MPSNTDTIINSFNTFFESNMNYTRKELLEFAKKTYDENYKKVKKEKKDDVEKKPLNAYQLFMKEQRIILNKRENERTDGEKMKSQDLMKEIAGMWKLQKARLEKKEGFVEEVKIEDKELKISDDEEDNEAKVVVEKKKKSNKK